MLLFVDSWDSVLEEKVCVCGWGEGRGGVGERKREMGGCREVEGRDMINFKIFEHY